jgi:hypothetical protein
MEGGQGSAQGMEAVARGLEATAKGAEKQLEQQRTIVDTMKQQMQVNLIMSMGENMGECPRTVKEQTLETWAEEVKLWSNQCPEPELSSLKYLNFVNSVRESDSIEMKRFIEISVMSNKDFIKTESNSINKIVNMVVKALGKSNIENASEVWLEFIDMKQNEGESIRDFVLRYENVEAKLGNANLVIPSKALAMQLLMKSNLTSASKENVLAKVDLDNETDLHTTIKKTLRELKSLSKSNTKEPAIVNLVEQKQEANSPRLETKHEPSSRLERKPKPYSKRYDKASWRMKKITGGGEKEEITTEYQ